MQIFKLQYTNLQMTHNVFYKKYSQQILWWISLLYYHYSL